MIFCKYIVIILIVFNYSTHLFGNIDILEYRKEFIKHNDINYLLELNKKELNHLVRQLTNIKNKNPEQKKIVLILKLLQYSKNVQKINKQDKEIISSYFSEIMCKSDKHIGLSLHTISEKLFTQKNNIFMKKMFKTEEFLKKNNNSRMIKYQTYNYLGPYIETYKTICDFDSNLTDKEIFKILKKDKTCNLKKNLLKDITIKELINKIKFGDKQIIANYNNITPFVAKIILTEIILSNLNKKEQKIFYNKIKNKTDYTEFTCGKFCNERNNSIKKDVDLIIVHNGYQLVNSIKGANLLEKYFESTIVDTELQTIGIECSLLIQRAIERTNIAQIKGRMKTAYMDYSLVNPKIAQKIILNYQNQLKTGDIVKLSGHTYVFVGYKKVNNYYYAVTIEATGGNLRSVGVFYRDFYDEKLGSFNKKLDNNGKIINVDKNEKHVIYRLR
jgi:hypothetical protein